MTTANGADGTAVAQPDPTAAMKLELVPIPVADIDLAKAFYR
ncbi:MAG: hypothetical protein V7637_6517, partial [Mycobacteriales bacterium]